LDLSTTINHELKVYLLHKNDEIIFRSLYHSTVPFLAMICRSIAEYPPVIKVNYCETGILEILD
jgi:hypothetical protein